jgi:hypothetical protein
MFLTTRILGVIVVVLFAAVGLAVASALLPLLMSLGVLAAFAMLCVRAEQPRLAASPFGASPVRLAAGVASGTVIVVYAVIGMTTLVGGAATALTAATVLAMLGYRRGWCGTAQDVEHATEGGSGSTGIGATDAAAVATGPQLLLPADPATLSTDELCRAWRVSYLLLETARDPEALEHAAQLRRRYLDELARRHPEGFRRWLDDGARAAGDPSRYVGHRFAAPDRDEDQAA